MRLERPELTPDLEDMENHNYTRTGWVRAHDPSVTICAGL